MKLEKFDKGWFERSKTLKGVRDKFSAGQVTIVGGSELFHGAPIMSLKAASRIASMIYFASPNEDKGVADRLKSELLSFVWVPFDDLDGYVAKSEAVLIGPGMMRSHVREHGYVCDDEGQKTRRLTIELLQKYPDKKWIIDGGSLQVVTLKDLPAGVIVTPNQKEFEMLFDEKLEESIDLRLEQVERLAKANKLVILTKDETSIVSDGNRTVTIEGGNDGMVKGGVGDVTAGVILGFLAKDDPVDAVSFGSYIVKEAGKNLLNERGLMFNADDLANEVPRVFVSL